MAKPKSNNNFDAYVLEALWNLRMGSTRKGGASSPERIVRDDIPAVTSK